MMIFYHIGGIERFFRVIDACSGGIFFQVSGTSSRHGVDKLEVY